MRHGDTPKPTCAHLECRNVVGAASKDLEARLGRIGLVHCPFVVLCAEAKCGADAKRSNKQLIVLWHAENGVGNHLHEWLLHKFSVLGCAWRAAPVSVVPPTKTK